MRSGAFEAEFLDALDATADQGSLAANERCFLDASLQNSTDNLLVRVIDHVHAERLVFCTNIFEHCGVIETTARAFYEDFRRCNDERLHCAQRLHELGANDNPAAAVFSGTSGDKNSSGVGVSLSVFEQAVYSSLSLRHIFHQLINFLDSLFS